jgi:hypothetical protein
MLCHANFCLSISIITSCKNAESLTSHICILRCIRKIHAFYFGMAAIVYDRMVLRIEGPERLLTILHADGSKTDAFGHFAAAAFRKVSNSLLFHELKSSSPSLASSSVTVGNFSTPTTSFSHRSADSGVSNFRTLRAESVRLA